MLNRYGLADTRLVDLVESEERLRALERRWLTTSDPQDREAWRQAMRRVGKESEARVDRINELLDNHRRASEDSDHVGMATTRNEIHQLANEDGTVISRFIRRHPDESIDQFEKRVLHLHAPYETSIHPGVIEFGAFGPRTREDVLNNRQPPMLPHDQRASAFSAMWRRETRGSTRHHRTTWGDEVKGTAVTFRRPEADSR